MRTPAVVARLVATKLRSTSVVVLETATVALVVTIMTRAAVMLRWTRHVRGWGWRWIAAVAR